MPIVPMEKGELLDFPLACDHAFTSSLTVTQRVKHARGTLDLERVEVPPDAVVVTINALDRSTLNRIKRRVRPRESNTGARVLAAVRRAGWDAHHAEVQAATAEGRPFRAEVQSRAAEAAVDALSDADRDAYEQNAEHELAYAYAVCDAAIECIRLPDGATIREALGEAHAARFGGDGYPSRWVLNRILAPSWSAQADAFFKDARKLLTEAAERQQRAAEALRAALGDDGAEMFANVWVLLDHYRGALIADHLSETPAAESKAGKHVKLARAALKGEALSELAEAAEATAGLVKVDIGSQWHGVTDPDAIALEISRHVARAAMLPKAQLT